MDILLSVISEGKKKLQPSILAYDANCGFVFYDIYLVEVHSFYIHLFIENY